MILRPCKFLIQTDSFLEKLLQIHKQNFVIETCEDA